MAIRVVEFSNGGTKLERFLPKNQHTQRKLLNIENWVNGEVSKVPKVQPVYCMAVRVVEFSNGGYKIRKIFA